MFFLYLHRQKNEFMNMQFEDMDLQELVETGKNKEYKKVAKVKPLMIGLAKAYKTLCLAPNNLGTKWHFRFFMTNMIEVENRRNNPDFPPFFVLCYESTFIKQNNTRVIGKNAVTLQP